MARSLPTYTPGSPFPRAAAAGPPPPSSNGAPPPCVPPGVPSGCARIALSVFARLSCARRNLHACSNREQAEQRDSPTVNTGELHAPLWRAPAPSVPARCTASGEVHRWCAEHTQHTAQRTQHTGRAQTAHLRSLVMMVWLVEAVSWDRLSESSSS